LVVAIIVPKLAWVFIIDGIGQIHQAAVS